MMDLQIIHNKRMIHDYLKNDSELQVYCIGDLDNFFWPKTIWYALVDEAGIKSLALLYLGMETPTLLMFDKANRNNSILLLKRIKSILPGKMFVHLSSGLIEVFGQNTVTEYYGLNYKMALKRTPPEINDSNIRRLSIKDIPLINDFYMTAYPNNWFDKKMIETDKYFGYFIEKKLVGISGIHVYSSQYKVAALGNIATHPDYRGNQIGFKLTAMLCNDLRKTVDHIGLNVKSDNEYAIKCYKKAGFEIIGEYEECLLRNEQGLLKSRHDTFNTKS